MTYLLLSPVDMSLFDDHDHFVESLDEFGLSFITSNGDSYITCKSLDVITQAVFTLDLPGDIIEYISVFESKETVTESYTE
jgi:hypothetical protein